MSEDERKNYAYLGDGVYAEYDGYGLWLRTGNHQHHLCDDSIYIEPDMLQRLNLFLRHAQCEALRKKINV